MKKLVITLTIITLLQGQPIVEDGSKEVDSIKTLFSEEGFTIDEWQVIIIDKISPRRFQQLLKKLETSYLATVVKDNSTLKYIIEAKNSSSNIHSAFQIIVPNNGDDVTVQTIISGSEWDQSIKSSYNSMTKQIKREYSLKFNKIFTCVKLDDNGIIINGFSNEKLWGKLNVINKNEHYDNVQHSAYEKEVYGYTPLWNSKVIVHGEPINFQMIFKNDDSNKKQVIIGTPIMLNEY